MLSVKVLLFRQVYGLENSAGQKKFYIYLLIISLLASAVLIRSVFVVDFKSVNISAVVFFIIITMAAESLSIELPRGVNISVGFTIDLVCLIIMGPYVAIWISVLSELLMFETLRGKPFYKTLFNCSGLVLSVWLAGWVYLALGGTLDFFPVPSVLPLAAAALTYFFVNSSALTISLALTQGSAPWGIWTNITQGVAPSLLALTPLALLMASMYKILGILGASFFFIPLFLVRYIFKAYMEVRQSYLSTLGALASALDAKDTYTKGHSDRVAMYAVEIARKLDFPEDKIETIEHMSLLHDIGKIGIGAEILCRPGKLTDNEFEHIKQHPVIGANILKNIRDFESSTDFVRYHHEKYDGSGYPYRLKGEQIPLEARIITLADSFDAMTSNRSYRRAMTFEEALEEVKRSTGTHFDPKIVEAFLNCWKSGTIPGKAEEPFHADGETLDVS